MTGLRLWRRCAAGLIAVVVGSSAVVGCTPAPVGPGSRCRTDALTLICPYNTTTLSAAGENRKVHWMVPLGSAPAGGWPVAIMFQGTLATAALSWRANPLEPFGAYEQTQVVQRLLDGGYAVLTPETHLAGLTFWDTNNPLVGDYLESGDHALMLRIFEGLDAGTFGDVDSSRLFATGISSGGYMTSRMAVSYPGKFKALVVAAGSYANCAGPLCVVGPIPGDHPPTLFLHGLLDPIVPAFTMELYYAALGNAGIARHKIINPLALHEWIKESPSAVVGWFKKYDT